MLATCYMGICWSKQLSAMFVSVSLAQICLYNSRACSVGLAQNVYNRFVWLCSAHGDDTVASTNYSVCIWGGCTLRLLQNRLQVFRKRLYFDLCYIKYWEYAVGKFLWHLTTTVTMSLSIKLCVNRPKNERKTGDSGLPTKYHQTKTYFGTSATHIRRRCNPNSCNHYRCKQASQSESSQSKVSQ